MSWSTAGSFLERFKGFHKPKDFAPELFLSVLEKKFNIILKRDDVEYKNGVFYIKRMGFAAKNQLFLLREKIKNEAKKEMASAGVFIKDIFFSN